MNLNYKSLLPADFSPDSRVWIYQSNRLFTLAEALQLEPLLEEFAGNWKSHGDPVRAYANLFFGQFIVLMADQRTTVVSGCSTDSSVHFIQQLEKNFQVSLFDRQLLAFLVKDKIQVLPLSQLGYALEKGFIDENTIYFNNTVQTKATMEEEWMVPLSKSWLARRLSATTS